ncbi:MAG: preprotein translocase subunit SecE [Tissierellia bacterium]|nr:preprotein translocase subunit SecE [Tissierellia bacterium]
MANVTEQKAKAPAPKGKGFLKGVRAEFKKVVWPSKKDTVNYVAVVVLISILVALFVYGLDYVFTSLLNLIVH